MSDVWPVPRLCRGRLVSPDQIRPKRGKSKLALKVSTHIPATTRRVAPGRPQSQFANGDGERSRRF
jgi:hypothetical protein